MSASAESQAIRPSIPDDKLVLYVKKGSTPIALTAFTKEHMLTECSESDIHRQLR